MNWSNKRALIYLRVSSDEQSTNNSLPDQHERLTKFCQLMNITVVKQFQDDYSAKTFDRPGWNELLQHIKRNKGKAELLLFTNWSRFSRAENMGETYMMIDQLYKLGVEPQAVESPLDLRVPENRLVLSFYIAAPAVENMRRRDNTTNGLHKSLADGRYCMIAPFGYDNSREQHNSKKPILTINEKEAAVVRLIYKLYLEGRPPKAISQTVREHGYPNRGNGAIQKTISNPLYAGLVKVFAYKDEAEKYVKGLHDPIIDLDTYWSAVAKFKTDSTPKPKLYADHLPLRGILHCQYCNRLLSSSRSRGRHGGHWWYYRCHKCRGENYSAKLVHREFDSLLSSLSLNQKDIEAFISIVDRQTKEVFKEHAGELQSLKGQLEKAERQLESLEQKYIANQIEFTTYQKYYPTFKQNCATLRSKIELLSASKEDMMKLYRETLPMLLNLNTLYDRLSIYDKQEFLRLVFIQGLRYTREGIQTPEINPLFAMKAAPVAGLAIAHKKQNGLMLPELLESRGKGSPGTPPNDKVIPLLRFLLRVAV